MNQNKTKEEKLRKLNEEDEEDELELELEKPTIEDYALEDVDLIDIITDKPVYVEVLGDDNRKYPFYVKPIGTLEANRIARKIQKNKQAVYARELLRDRVYRKDGKTPYTEEEVNKLYGGYTEQLAEHIKRISGLLGTKEDRLVTSIMEKKL
jgi:hypothetical protein